MRVEARRGKGSVILGCKVISLTNKTYCRILNICIVRESAKFVLFMFLWKVQGFIYGQALNSCHIISHYSIFNINVHLCCVIIIMYLKVPKSI